jgi:meso-butanediol dehydrogenase/(S,S)-butanediol dehydrogenase/diacetyl reductase
VTGGASGLGYGIAEALVRAGASVVIGDINEDAVRNAAAKLNGQRVVPVHLDVTRAESVSAAVETCRREFGGLDTLVNCAGTFMFRSLADMSEAEWDRLIDTNMKGVFLCCRAAAPMLCGSGRGRIVNISSDAGKKGFPLISAYCASKFGVIGFSKAIAGELASAGVTVNCVCPTGVTATAMGQQILGWLAEKTGTPVEAILRTREQSVPLGRMASVEDVVGAVMFFVSDSAGFITGEALNVDGGVLSTGVVPGIRP